MYTRHSTREIKNSIDSIMAYSPHIIIIALYLLCLFFSLIAITKSPAGIVLENYFHVSGFFPPDNNACIYVKKRGLPKESSLKSSFIQFRISKCLLQVEQDVSSSAVFIVSWDYFDTESFSSETNWYHCTGTVDEWSNVSSFSYAVNVNVC